MQFRASSAAPFVDFRPASATDPYIDTPTNRGRARTKHEHVVDALMRTSAPVLKRSCELARNRTELPNRVPAQRHDEQRGRCFVNGGGNTLVVALMTP